MVSKKREATAGRCPQRGKRYNAAQKVEVVAWSDSHGIEAAVAKHGVSRPSVVRWRAARRRAGRVAPVTAVAGAGDVEARTSASKSSSTADRDRSARTPATRAKRSPAAATPTAKTAPTVVTPTPTSSAQAGATTKRKGRKGRRYGVVEKQEALREAAQRGVAEAARQLGVSRWSLYEWGRRQATAKTTDEAQAALAPRSSRPKKNAQKLDEARYHLIADTWLANQALGPRQVRNLVRRSHGVRAATSTVRRVIQEYGYVPPKITVERKAARRYEAVRRGQQLHLDFVHFYVHKAKVYLLFIEDDFSRFIVEFGLCEGERAQPVIAAFEAAIARHGKPESVVVDGGSGFFSWRGQSQLERVCEDYGIDFIKAGKAGGNAKLEALNGSVRRELLNRVEFADLDDARRKVAEWVRFYNLARPHEGLGGLLVPADRFFGRTDEVMAQLERGEPVVVPGLGLDTRPLELFRVISRGGRPELWLLGERLWPSSPPTV